jgi:hypothetical protein
VNSAFALEPLPNSRFNHKVDGALFEHACPDRRLDRPAAAQFNYDGTDSPEMKKMREQ